MVAANVGLDVKVVARCVLEIGRRATTITLDTEDLRVDVPGLQISWNYQTPRFIMVGS